MNPTDQQRVRAYLRLHLADGIGAVTFRTLVETFGGVVAAAEAGPGRWRQVEGVGPKKVQALGEVTDELIDQEIAALAAGGATVLCLEDEAYPAALKTIHDPPPVLYVLGEMRATDAVAMGIVGSRRCTHYGAEQAERFGQLLGRAGFTVVSGGARGIDTAAHRGALAAGGRTVAVMGCGLGTFYPPENADLFRRIIDENAGAIVSEIPMGRGVESRNFPKRNRIISGLSLGVLIVEAAKRSGSLITAREANEQGRTVFALPGRVDSPLSFGTNSLIRDGVSLVQNLDDILDQLGEVGVKMVIEEAPEAPIPAGLDDAEQRLVAALGEGERSLDELVRATEIPSGAAASAMTMLVLKGLVVQRPGNVFARKRRKKGS